MAPLALLFAVVVGGAIYPGLSAGAVRSPAAASPGIPAADTGWTVGELRSSNDQTDPGALRRPRTLWTTR